MPASTVPLALTIVCHVFVSVVVSMFWPPVMGRSSSVLLHLSQPDSEEHQSLSQEVGFTFCSRQCPMFTRVFMLKK